MHSVGSRTALQNLFKNQEFRNVFRIFSLAPDRKNILQAGENILLLLLVGKREKTLNELRVHKYHEKMSGQTQNSMNVAARGPTSDAAQYCVDKYFGYKSGEERGLCNGFLKLGLAADKTGNNVDGNDQTSSTTRAVKSI